MLEPSSLQKSLEKGHISRDFSLVCDIFKRGGVNLNGEIFGRLVMDPNSKDSLCVLDVGSGTSETIEQCTRGLMTTAKRLIIDRKIKGIGVDINPVTDVSPRVLEMGKDVGLGEELVSDIRVGDVGNLPVEDNSVDVLYSSNVLQYVTDTLKAFEEGWRVLKEGGVAYWDVDERNISAAPGFKKLLEMTPGASEVFQYIPINQTDGFVICRKMPGAIFKGFPFKVAKELKFKDFEGAWETTPDQVAHHYRNAVYTAAPDVKL